MIIRMIVIYFNKLSKSSCEIEFKLDINWMKNQNKLSNYKLPCFDNDNMLSL